MKKFSNIKNKIKNSNIVKFVKKHKTVILYSSVCVLSGVTAYNVSKKIKEESLMCGWNLSDIGMTTAIVNKYGEEAAKEVTEEALEISKGLVDTMNKTKMSPRQFNSLVEQKLITTHIIEQ